MRIWAGAEAGSGDNAHVAWAGLVVRVGGWVHLLVEGEAPRERPDRSGEVGDRLGLLSVESILGGTRMTHFVAR
jgi:hypothetical protein